MVLDGAGASLATLVLRTVACRRAVDGRHRSRLRSRGSVLIIGFGRFGQVVSQSLLAHGFDIAIIDTDTDQIRSAADFGFKIILRGRLPPRRAARAGAEQARLIAVCVDDRAAANRVVELARREFARRNCWCAPTIASTRSDWCDDVDYLVRERRSNRPCASAGPRCANSAWTRTRPRRSPTKYGAATKERFELIASGFAAGRHLLLGNA